MALRPRLAAAHRARLESRMLTVAATRKQELASLIENDPGEVSWVALPAAVRSSLPRGVSAYLEQDAQLGGTLEIKH